MEDWDWNGPDDGQFQFAIAKDAKRLYLAIDFSDDHTILLDDITQRQDKFYVYIDTQGKVVKLELAASKNPKKPMIKWLEGRSIPIDVAIVKTATGQVLEMSMPLKSFFANTPDLMRLNIGIMDHDRPENTKPSVLWWRPLWESESTYEGSGVFNLE